MLVRETQTPAYWRGFAVDDRDLDYLDDLFLEDERPHTGDDLTLALMRKRCEDEESLIEKELARGILFQPKESYEVGQQVVFPVLGYALGPVVGVRPGYNPRYGDFEVIQVHFEGGEEPREFASKLDFFHKLNREEGEGSEADDLVSLTELYDRYGVDTQRILIEHLHHSEDFVSFGDEWFLKGLLTDIHEGLLNIVEAMLDVNGMPLPAQELIQELDLPAEISPSTQVFSLNYALTQDDRFDDVGSDDQILWFLRRLEPPEIAHLPLRLRYSPVLYDRVGLGDELLRWEMEIDDEIVGLVAPGADEEISSATITLNYPHRRVGSIPLTSKIESLFPKGNVGRMMITLIDGRTGARMLGWVVRQHNYVYGLKEWYDKNDLPVGAYIELEKTDDPMAIVVDYSRQRKKREWIRVATVVGGKLSFSMQMRSIGCKYDELMVLDEANQAEIDALWMRSEEEGKPISELMRDIFPELAKLNPQGTVHAKTLYSAINIERRCPPGPILAGLANMLSFMAVGDGYWVYDQEAL
ncbi:MAG: hypothetical protein H8E47_09620 [Anaerolineales bacterium]|nr:hypothetical protein [Anaerolineales bacterium]